MNYILLISLFFYSFTTVADDVVAVGEAQLEKVKLTVSVSTDKKTLGVVAKDLQEFVEIVENDFQFYKDDIETLLVRGEVSEYKGHLLRFSKDLEKSLLTYELLTQDKQKMIEGSLDLSKIKVRKNAHFIADEVFQRLVGRESIFLSSIVFVSDRESKNNKVIKEVYKMDFDGFNKKRLTFHNAMVISPAVSSDGKKILYSLISNNVKKRNINLYMMDLETGKHELLSSQDGLNSGAVFMPGDQKILLTLSHQDNAEIYQMDLKTKSLKRLTRHYAPDVDPSINKNGDKMVFLSGRSLGPNIYRMDLKKGEESTERISFVGKFNATPRFSPDGSEIAFSSWIENKFEIFRISADKTKLFRLTKDFGSNEDPTYSNDGQFIAFSSQKVISEKQAVNNIYIMSRDGLVLAQLTSDYGKCITPRWTK